MNAFVRKEIRGILPAWMLSMLMVLAPLALVAMVGAGLLREFPEKFVYFTLGWAALVLGAAAFGQEFGHRTFQLLLAQPVSRKRLWWTKTGLSGAAGFSLLLLVIGLYGFVAEAMNWAGLSGKGTLNCAAIFFTCFTGVLWTTILLRKEIAAFGISILLPGAITLVAGWALDSLPETTVFAITLMLLGIYSAGGFLFARWLFERAQDVEWTGGTVTLPAWFGGRWRASAGRGSGRAAPLTAVFRREIQSHHVTWMFAAALVVLHLATVWARFQQSGREPSSFHLIASVSWFLVWLALPFVIGGMAVAEERRLGTFEGLLCLPVSRRAQYSIKLGVALVLSVLLCALIPWTIESVALANGVPHGLIRELFDVAMFGIISTLVASMTLVSFYASTLSRNTLPAIGIAFLLNLPVLALGSWAYGVTFDTSTPHTFWEVPLLVDVSVLTMLAAWLWLAWRNFSHVQVGAAVWKRNVMASGAAICLALLTTFLLHNRVWEHFMRLEPQHGPARWDGPVRPVIHREGPNMILLLPDGRIWMNTTAQLIFRSEVRSDGDAVRDIIPRGGQFLENSNWVSLAATVYEAMAVRSDGSIWRIDWLRWRDPAPADIRNPPELIHTTTVPAPEQVDAGPGWKTVAGSSHRFLALKEDGTLWQRIIDPRVEQVAPFTRVGDDADWNAVYAALGVSIGVKRDGSVWKWGYLGVLPDGSPAMNRDYADPLPWSLNGSNWVDRVGHSYDLAVHRDGTLWISGIPPQNTFGEARDPVFLKQPQPVREDRQWRNVSDGGNTLAGIDAQGELVFGITYRPVLPWDSGTWNPSRYSDWIAVDANWNGVVALAADGTVSAWQLPRERTRFSDTLGPTRRPAWSLNIFDDTAAPARVASAR